MKRLGRLKHFIVGFLVGSLLFSGVSFAASGEATLKVLRGIKIIQSGIDRTPLDEDMKPFVANGRTFVSLRAVSELLDVDINWDGKNSAVILGKIPKGEPMPAATSFYNNDNNRTVFLKNVQMKVGGSSYGKTGFMIQNVYYDYDKAAASVSYNLNAKYKTLNLAVGADDSSDGTTSKLVEFRDQDNNLLHSVVVGPNVVEKDINIDVTGVLKLTINIYGTGFSYANVDFINPILIN